VKKIKFLQDRIELESISPQQKSQNWESSIITVSHDNSVRCGCPSHIDRWCHPPGNTLIWVHLNQLVTFGSSQEIHELIKTVRYEWLVIFFPISAVLKAWTYS